MRAPTTRPAWPRTRRWRSRSTSAALATSSSDPAGERRRSGRLRAAVEQVLPIERFGDERTILAGTGQSAIGLVVAILATFATQVLITRVQGPAAFGIVTLAAVIAAVASLAVAALVFAVADPLARAFAEDEAAAAGDAFRAGALAIPFVALVQVYLGGTRGLKVMRHTLYVFWMGQPLGWLVLILVGWLVARSVGVTTLAYSASWLVATGAAAARAAQVILLFIISVSLMFSPFVADLHARGERDTLDRLFKQITRWTMAATLPLFVVLAVTPSSALRLFGSEFGAGRTALLILLLGQLVNVATGTVGFVLIM